MNEISKFYKGLLEALDLEVNASGLISINAYGIKKPLDINGTLLYLPTDENVNTTVELVNGTPTPVKVLFNPLEEDVFKGVNEGFNKLKGIMELKLMAVISQVGISLLSIMAEDNSSVDDMELVKFVNVLNRQKRGTRKQLVDTKTVATWINMYDKMLSKLDHKYIKLFIKKGGKIDGVKYNRVGTITFPFMEKFKEAVDKKEKVLDSKLRAVDIHVITSLFDYIFETLEPSGINQFGSLNKKSPSLHTLLLAYDGIYKRLLPIITTIIEHGVEDDIVTALSLRPLPIRAETLGDYIDTLEAEVRRVPNEAVTTATNPLTNKPSVIATAGPNTIEKSGKGGFWDNTGGSAQQTLPPINQQAQPVYQQTPPIYQQAHPVYQQTPPINQQAQPAYQQVSHAHQHTQTPVNRQPPVNRQNSNPYGMASRVNDDPWEKQPQSRYIQQRPSRW